MIVHLLSAMCVLFFIFYFHFPNHQYTVTDAAHNRLKATSFLQNKKVSCSHSVQKASDHWWLGSCIRHANIAVEFYKQTVSEPVKYVKPVFFP